MSTKLAKRHWQLKKVDKPAPLRLIKVNQNTYKYWGGNAVQPKEYLRKVWNMSFEMCESVFLLKNCLRYIKSNTNIKSRPYENRDLHIIYRKFPVCRKIALSHTLLLSDATSFSSLDYIYVMYVYKHKCLFYQNISFSDFWPSVESGWSLLKVKLLGEMK